MTDAHDHTAQPGEEHAVFDLNYGEDQKRIWEQLSGNTERIFQMNTAPMKIWPELVGLSGEEAKAKILSENPSYEVFLLPENSFVTMDYRPKRVRLFLDHDGNVSKVPRVG